MFSVLPLLEQQNMSYAQTSSNSFSSSSVINPSSTTPNQITSTQPLVTFTTIKLDQNIVPNQPFKLSVGVTSVNPSSNLILSLTVPTGISIISAPFPTLTYTINQNERMATWTLIAARAGIYNISVNSYSPVPYETDSYSMSVPVGALNSLIVTGVDVPGNIYPNDKFLVGLKLKNAANIPDTMVRAQITVPAGLELLDSVSSPSISLNTTQETEFYWHLQAQTSGSYPINFDYSSANSGDNNFSASVNVGSIGVPDISISSITLGGSNSLQNLVGSGDKNVPLVVELSNTGTDDLYNLEGTLFLGKPFSNDTSTSGAGQLPSEDIKVGKLAVSKNVNMTFYVNIENPTQPNTYVNKLQVSFVDGKQQIQKILDVPVTIANGVLLSLTAQKVPIYANIVTPVTLEIKNTGNVAVHNLQITSTFGNLFTAVDTPVWIGDLVGGQTKEAVLKVVSANNTQAQYPIPINLSYDANGQTYTSSYQVSAQSSTTPDFYVQTVTLTPSQSYSGDIAHSVAIQLLNAGLTDANNVKATLNLPTGFTPAWGNATNAFLGRVKSSETATATFYVNIASNVTAGNYPLTLVVNNDQQTKQLNVNFVVAQKAIFKVINVDASQLYPGATSALFPVTLQNIGTDTASTLTTTLLAGNTVPGVKSSDITTVGTQENIGNVLPGQVFTTTFIVDIDPLASSGNKQDSIQLNWVNAGSISFIQTVPLPYNLANGPWYLLYVGPVPVTYVIVAIGLIIGLVIFLKHRKARIKSITSAWPAEIQLGQVSESPTLDVTDNQVISGQKAFEEDVDKSLQNQKQPAIGEDDLIGPEENNQPQQKRTIHLKDDPQDKK